MPTDPSAADASASQNQDQSVANQGQGGKTPPKRDPVLTEREALLARMDEQILEAREADDQYAIDSGDTRTAQMKAEMLREASGRAIRTDSRQGRQVADRAQAQPIDQDDQDAGADYVPEATTVVDEPPPTRQRAAPVAEDGVDPLADFIVRKSGQAPMFRALVNGQERLIPLEQARAQLQKHVHADIRVQRASEREKALDAREARLRGAEQQVTTRPTVTPIDDATLDTESQELVRSLVNEPEAKAAVKVKGVLKKILASVPQVDTNILVRQAVDIAKKEIAAETNQTALVRGLTEFENSYQDIVGDPDLYNLADRKTEMIAAEHPDWTPAQIMSEAGEQVREWMGKVSGKPYVRKPGTRQSAGGEGAVQQGQNRRQQVKQTLKPMPQPRSARPAQGADPNQEDSPQDAVNEIRKSRGQLM